MPRSMRITAAALALVTGLTGAAQAESFNIFSASRAQEARDNGTLEEVGRRHGHRHGRHWGHRRGFNPGVGIALGTMGLIAGAAAASAYDRRYYCDPYYEYCGPRRVYRRHYYAPRYYRAPRYYYYD